MKERNGKSEERKCKEKIKRKKNIFLKRRKEERESYNFF